MSVWQIVVPVVIIVSVVALIIWKFTRDVDERQVEMKGWEIGDKLILTEEWWRKLESVNQSYGVLKGWDEEHVYVQFGSNVSQLEYHDIKHNKSWIWRENYRKCEEFMGKAPLFDAVIQDHGWDNKKDEPKQDGTIHGKNISELTETECQVYLKECLENEEYELAEMIKEQMEKFR